MSGLEFDSPFQLTHLQSGVTRQQFPKLFRVKQRFPRETEPDVPGAVRRELAPFLARVKAGQRIAVTAGSRGIVRLPEIRTFALADAREAQRISESRHFRGKLVLTVR